MKPVLSHGLFSIINQCSKKNPSWQLYALYHSIPQPIQEPSSISASLHFRTLLKSCRKRCDISSAHAKSKQAFVEIGVWVLWIASKAWSSFFPGIALLGHFLRSSIIRGATYSITGRAEDGALDQVTPWFLQAVTKCLSKFFWIPESKPVFKASSRSATLQPARHKNKMKSITNNSGRSNSQNTAMNTQFQTQLAWISPDAVILLLLRKTLHAIQWPKLLVYKFFRATFQTMLQFQVRTVHNNRAKIMNTFPPNEIYTAETIKLRTQKMIKA